MTIPKLRRAAHRLQALHKQIETARESLPDACKLVDDSQSVDDASEVTAKVLAKAATTAVVTRGWTTGTAKLHLARYAAPAIARLTETEYRVERIEGRETALFKGFEHDVEHALLLLTLVRAYAERCWERFFNSGEYRKLTRSGRVMARTQMLVERSNEIRDVVARKAGDEAMLRQNDRDARERVILKRGIVARAEDRTSA